MSLQATEARLVSPEGEGKMERYDIIMTSLY